MSDLQIARHHGLGLEGARTLVERWIGEAERDLSLACEWQRGEAGDLVRFRRSGVQGELRVSAASIELEASLGFLLRPYRSRIEAALNANLDRQLSA